MKVVEEFEVIIHRNGDIERIAKKKYKVLKAAKAVFLTAFLAIILTAVIFIAMSACSLADAVIALYLTEFSVLTLTGIFWIAVDMFWS